MDCKPDIIVPIMLNLNRNPQTMIGEILEQKERYGITRFMLTGPEKGWRGLEYPPREHYEKLAEQYNEIREALKGKGITLGWWCMLTVKSGRLRESSAVIKNDGSEHPFSNCPLDPVFQERLAEDIAYFARTTNPAFIITEDDYSITASGGCFCPRHVEMFSQRMGRVFTREEIRDRLHEFQEHDVKLAGAAQGKQADDPLRYSPERVAFEKEWRKLKRDTMVMLSQKIRQALDRETPHIPMGYMQAGSSDQDGDSTEAIARALAGENHMPFVRFYCTSYSGIDIKSIPSITYHAVYNRQHIGQPFRFYQEADTYPHTRFYMAGSEMKCLMATMFSQGFDGATFQTQCLNDDPNEEHAYGDMHREEQARFGTVARIAKQCERKGACIFYDPFWNTYDKTMHTSTPLWLESVTRFGVPYTTLDSEISFIDARQAAYAEEEELMRLLSRGVFVDGDAAMLLCKRGFGKYLGVKVENTDLSDGMVRWDLDAHEVIRPPFAGKGREIAIAHAYSPAGNGKALKITVTNPDCEVLTDLVTYDGRNLGPGMTRFINSLGGKAVVMGLTLDGNHSHALMDYRRQRLIQNLIRWMDGDIAYVKGQPLIETIMNEAKNPSESGLKGMLTLINLCADPAKDVALYLPPSWRNANTYAFIEQDGSEQTLSYSPAEDGICLKRPLSYLEPLYLVIR